jgi:hypothetical protein
VSAQAYISLGLGNVDAKEVQPEGLVIGQSKTLSGRSAPQMFYVAYDYLSLPTISHGDRGLKPRTV